MQIKELIPWGRDKQEVERKSETEENPIAVLQRDVNRIFDDFWSRFDHRPGGSGSLVDALGPSTDVSESDDEIEVSVELPGLDEKDIDVSLSGDMLTIRGEKKAQTEKKKRGYYLSERSYGSFYRSVPLPPGVETDKASAEFKRGVLTVTLPKSPEMKAETKRIEVKGV